MGTSKDYIIFGQLKFLGVNFTITFAYILTLMYLANIFGNVYNFTIYILPDFLGKISTFFERNKKLHLKNLVYNTTNIQGVHQMLFFFLQDFKIYSGVAVTDHTLHLPRCRGVCTPSFTLGPPDADRTSSFRKIVAFRGLTVFS